MIMLILTGMVLIELFDLYPLTYTILKVLCVTYMLYLAWKIAHATPVTSEQATGNPMTFLRAAAFQWINTKAWTMALTSVTVYVADHGMLMLLLASLCFGAINLPSMSLWTVLGQQMARLLTRSHHLRLFNLTMAVLLIGSLYSMLRPG
jgi:threonine/homoserine/homoserine lactone efflux protein